MKFLKQKRSAVILLVFIMFFIVFAENAHAENGDCRCLASKISLTDHIYNKYFSVGTFANASSCEYACSEKGYKAYCFYVGITDNSCNDISSSKVASGSLASGAKCTLKTDECADGLYCKYNKLSSNVCATKIADGEFCSSSYSATASETANKELNNCMYGCKSSKYRLDTKSTKNAMNYVCGSSEEEATKKTDDEASTAADGSISGTATGGGIVTCGRSGGTMCTLCDLIKGISDIVKYLRNIAIGIAVLALTIGGVMYVVSAGEPGMIEMAKTTMKNAGIGLVIVLAAYLVISTTILYIGTKSDLGIGASWYSFTFDCGTTSAKDTDTKDTDKKNTDILEISTAEWK